MSPSGTRQRPDENRRQWVITLSGDGLLFCMGDSATVEGEESGSPSSDKPGRPPRVGLISLALADIYLTFHFMFPFCRAATGVRDENLNARALADSESSRRNVMQRWKLWAVLHWIEQKE